MPNNHQAGRNKNKMKHAKAIQDHQHAPMNSPGMSVNNMSGKSASASASSSPASNAVNGKSRMQQQLEPHDELIQVRYEFLYSSMKFRFHSRIIGIIQKNASSKYFHDFSSFLDAFSWKKKVTSFLTSQRVCCKFCIEIMASANAYAKIALFILHLHLSIKKYVLKTYKWHLKKSKMFLFRVE